MNGQSPERRTARPAAFVPGAVVLLLAALALGPVLLGRGYVLFGDMTFVPRQPWKSAWLGLDGSVPRAVPADAVVSVLTQVVAGDLLQKAVLLGVLVLAGLGVLRLTARVAGLAVPARLGGAVLYLWNPFVFERLAIGHWGLLVGYAALPWVLAAALDVRRGAPGAHGRLLLLLLVAAVGSPSGGLVAGLLAVGVVVDHRRLPSTALVLGSVAVVNLPWLVPALVNDATPSDAAGVPAFAARADTPFGAWGSLLTFGGLWKGATAPPERDSWLLAGLALVVAVASLAALVAHARVGRRSESLAAPRLAAVAVVGLVLAGLPATGPGERLVADLVGAVPGAGLWRDSQKWLMPFVLVACLGFTLLLDAVAGWLRRRELAAGAMTAALALLPVVLLPSLAWGLSGRFDPVSYPEEWSTVRSLLDRQPADARRTAVLPWSTYQRFAWNGGRAALDPAIRFFPGQVLTNEDLVLDARTTVAGEDPASARIGAAVRSGTPLGPVLAAEGVRFLLVEKSAAGGARVEVPAGTVLHDGPELTLLDLGGPVRLARSPRPAVVVAADVATGFCLLLAAAASIRGRRIGTIRYDSRGRSHDGVEPD